MPDLFQLEPLLFHDLDRLNAVAQGIHPGLPERPAVFAEKIGLFPEGCRKFLWQGQMLGYGIAHPWQRDAIPPLDAFLRTLPSNPDCLYLHDVALAPEARGKGGLQRYMDYIKGVARVQGLASLALVSVYGTAGMWSRFGFAESDSEPLHDKLMSYGNGARYMICPL